MDDMKAHHKPKHLDGLIDPGYGIMGRTKNLEFTLYTVLKKGVKHHDWLIAEFCLWFSGMGTRTGTPPSSQNLAPDDVTEQDGSNIMTKLCPVTHFLLEWLHATPSGKRWYYWSGWVTCFKMLTFARVGHIFCLFLSLGKHCLVLFFCI